jgi:hypothetical protein
MGVYGKLNFRGKDGQIPCIILLIDRDTFNRYVGSRDIRGTAQTRIL